jgi:nitric oxide reductase activation protein
MAEGGGEGGGSADWLPIYDRVEAMLSKTQAEAEAEALAADRARLEAADRVHRESREAVRMLQRTVEELQATAREKDVEMDRLREEAADARKKLQEVRQVIHSIAIPIPLWIQLFLMLDCVLVGVRRM